MIEKFNFYDVYGYFLPGVAFLFLMWLPVGLATHSWPTDVASAVAAVIAAYILGHILQTLAVKAFPSQIRYAARRRRAPSDILLDERNATLCPEVKTQLRALLKKRFGIDVGADADEQLTRKREDAFFLSRGFLIRNKMARYAEQFEGMYSLMRGLAAAFFLGSAYLVGWSLSRWQSGRLDDTAPIALGIGLLLAVVLTVVGQLRGGLKLWLERVILISVAVCLGCWGYLFGVRTANSASQSTLLALIAAAVLFCSLRCFGSYKTFAQAFAKAVWRDFLSSQLIPGSPEKDD